MVKSIAAKIAERHPTVIPRIDYRLQDDLDGEGVRIASWNEAKLGPQPTIEEIEAWQPPVERRKVSKDLVEQRLAAIGKLDACMAIIMGNAAFFTRWYARAFPWVYADDTDTIAVIEAVEADPESILGPE